jgi:hypothetical protein
VKHLATAAAVVLVLCAASSFADEQEAAKKAPFENMEKAIRGADEKLFKAQWHADGYEKNLVGGSGIAGAGVFKQGSRKKWYPKPDHAAAKAISEGAVIVPCEIWSWEKEKSVDKVDMLLVRVENDEKKKVWVVLGGGEKRAEVEALAARWEKKEPLAPPAKGEK